MDQIQNWYRAAVSHCDAPERWQMSTQDPATPIMEWMVEFHNFIMCDLLLTSGIVGFFLYAIIAYFSTSANKVPNRSFAHDSELEIAWTLYPTLILILIAFPSFTLLYALDELIDPELTLKIVGHQWYWSYEYAGTLLPFQAEDFLIAPAPINFDSYMIPTSDLTLGRFRLLEVDNRVKLPIKTHIRLLITASDVLHSWAIPSFGIKVDACPGRLSQANVFIKRAGVYYGQCSEICGINHGFMPIVVEALDSEHFVSWVSKVRSKDRAAARELMMVGTTVSGSCHFSDDLPAVTTCLSFTRKELIELLYEYLNSYNHPKKEAVDLLVDQIESTISDAMLSRLGKRSIFYYVLDEHIAKYHSLDIKAFFSSRSKGAS